MSSDTSPWYARLVIGIGAWVTALVLIALGAVFIFSLLNAENVAFAVFGAVFFVFGLWMLWQGSSSVFAEQLGIAAAAAGGAMLCGGLTLEANSLWAGFVVASIVLLAVVLVTDEKILQFLAAALASGFYATALFDTEAAYALNFIALATPAGIALLLYPPRRDLMPTAVALLLTFPVVTIISMDRFLWRDDMQQSAQFAQILHIMLFLGLVYLHWRRSASNGANWQVLAFAAAAVLVCLLLPPGGSAAMLILMLSFVIGSRPFAFLGAALQSQFIVRYYYSLEMNLLDKSLLMMGVGGVLLVLWWLARRADSRTVPL